MALSPYEIANEEFACAHETTELRIKTAVNGALSYVHHDDRQNGRGTGAERRKRRAPSAHGWQRNPGA